MAHLKGCQPDMAGVVVRLDGEDVAPHGLRLLLASITEPALAVSLLVLQLLVARPALEGQGACRVRHILLPD